MRQDRAPIGAAALMEISGRLHPINSAADAQMPSKGAGTRQILGRKGVLWETWEAMQVVSNINFRKILEVGVCRFLLEPVGNLQALVPSLLDSRLNLGQFLVQFFDD